MQHWLKVGYFTHAREDARYWLDRGWVSDGPGRASPRWQGRGRPGLGEPYPSHGPRYQVDDLLVIYLTGSHRCPAIMRVTNVPRWDPDWVDENATLGEGDVWGVVTEVEGLWAVDPRKAPHVKDIGVRLQSVQRKGRLKLTEDQYSRAERLIARGRRRARPTARSVRTAPLEIEEGTTDDYQTATAASTKRALRKEQGLVRAYAGFLRAQGDAVCRHRTLTADGDAVVSDLFNETRAHLVEAKAQPTRSDIRMAIGQLADYRRFAPPGSRKAVLLDEKPTADLQDLLRGQGIAAIWRDGEGFVDDAGGAFT